jgi:hypothetical protein
MQGAIKGVVGDTNKILEILPLSGPAASAR